MLKKVKASEPRVKMTRKGFERESEGHNSRIERETDNSRVQKEKRRKGQDAVQGYRERKGERDRKPFKGTEREWEKGTGCLSRVQ